jgi:hypothetical protein
MHPKPHKIHYLGTNKYSLGNQIDVLQTPLIGNHQLPFVSLPGMNKKITEPHNLKGMETATPPPSWSRGASRTRRMDAMDGGAGDRNLRVAGARQ